jgi:hypothetical protein
LRVFALGNSAGYTDFLTLCRVFEGARSPIARHFEILQSQYGARRNRRIPRAARWQGLELLRPSYGVLVYARCPVHVADRPEHDSPHHGLKLVVYPVDELMGHIDSKHSRGADAIQDAIKKKKDISLLKRHLADRDFDFTLLR